MEAKLLVIPNCSETMECNYLVKIAFEDAYKEWLRNPTKIVFDPMSIGDRCTLYSYRPTNCHSHISLLALWQAMKHAIKKDKLYITREGIIEHPAIEIMLGEKLDLLLEYQAQLRKSAHVKSFGLFWNSILWISKAANEKIRSFCGEEIIDFFSSEDRKFFGSLHTRTNKVFISIHGRSKEDVLRGAGILMAIFLN